MSGSPDAQEPGMFYLLICRACGSGDLVMPFSSAQERGEWAAVHTALTGHEQWWVKDLDTAKAPPG